ncbi:imidazole glycerol phosphate synthase subunit HisH [Bifidobacterium gallicum]|uniref:Imidazole glycerol phosphate synthase subunit HisH n=1 Tax=Bifidobacterium gallicum DSM 20093 = LMG 11596 TaxID=561180 RepID=D1NSU3_9BIFI|nr:imidazole glycerol phosphate synthase subunit HisH [Bifidobacterium gallicum]EFA23745.1 imidazole glycerol phosphate synthase, glutamine amidotransferase subunit [Bifidobacterium gallicum DSM 20093 = LMG 11596]KFI59237.1 glutamine amidotransferase [Bifidobacterium gallicum DSM 20093 = LMG 11596]
MTSVVVFDYGFGNVRSMMRALANLGLDVTLTSDYRSALEADGLVVPGVGAFAACMQGLQRAAGDRVIIDRLRANRPVLGVCVGEQIMFQTGEENGDAQAELDRLAKDIEADIQADLRGATGADSSARDHMPHVEAVSAGLGLIGGDVQLLDADVVPHMGWDTVQAAEGSTLLHGIEQERFYYVHSYAAMDASIVDTAAHGIDLGNTQQVSWCEYGRSRFVAVVEQGPLFATQFHPEKSAEAGAQLLRNWVGVL